jgi:16S rRNA (guanine527-N7)-methyltransferase
MAAAAAELGLTLSPLQHDCFERYLALFDEWRFRVRLTGARSAEALVMLVAGALCVLPFVPESGRLADLGSGAGVLGLPIAILRDKLRVVLVEATQKKAAFLTLAARRLELANVEVVSARAEDLGRDVVHRGRYDMVAARALAPVRVLVEYALPLMKVGASAVLPKGRRAADEVRAAARALQIVGGNAILHAPRPPLCSAIVVINKTTPTPDGYPRRAGIPERRPL